MQHPETPNHAMQSTLHSCLFLTSKSSVDQDLHTRAIALRNRRKDAIAISRSISYRAYWGLQVRHDDSAGKLTHRMGQNRFQCGTVA